LNLFVGVRDVSGTRIMASISVFIVGAVAWFKMST